MLPPILPSPIIPICICLLLVVGSCQRLPDSFLSVVNPAATCALKTHEQASPISQLPRPSVALMTPKAYFLSGTWRSPGLPDHYRLGWHVGLSRPFDGHRCKEKPLIPNPQMSGWFQPEAQWFPVSPLNSW